MLQSFVTVRTGNGRHFAQFRIDKPLHRIFVSNLYKLKSATESGSMALFCMKILPLKVEYLSSCLLL